MTGETPGAGGGEPAKELNESEKAIAKLLNAEAEGKDFNEVIDSVGKKVLGIANIDTSFKIKKNEENHGAGRLARTLSAEAADDYLIQKWNDKHKDNKVEDIEAYQKQIDKKFLPFKIGKKLIDNISRSKIYNACYKEARASIEGKNPDLAEMRIAIENKKLEKLGEDKISVEKQAEIREIQEKENEAIAGLFEFETPKNAEITSFEGAEGLKDAMLEYVKTVSSGKEEGDQKKARGKILEILQPNKAKESTEDDTEEVKDESDKDSENDKNLSVTNAGKVYEGIKERLKALGENEIIKSKLNSSEDSEAHKEALNAIDAYLESLVPQVATGNAEIGLAAKESYDNLTIKRIAGYGLPGALLYAVGLAFGKKALKTVGLGVGAVGAGLLGARTAYKEKENAQYRQNTRDALSGEDVKQDAKNGKIGVKTAQSIIGKLTEFNKQEEVERTGDNSVDSALETIADYEARKELQDQNQIQIIGYSDKNKIEQEKLEILKAIDQAKKKIENSGVLEKLEKTPKGESETSESSEPTESKSESPDDTTSEESTSSEETLKSEIEKTIEEKKSKKLKELSESLNEVLATQKNERRKAAIRGGILAGSLVGAFASIPQITETVLAVGNGDSLGEALKESFIGTTTAGAAASETISNVAAAGEIEENSYDMSLEAQSDGTFELNGETIKPDDNGDPSIKELEKWAEQHNLEGEFEIDEGEGTELETASSSESIPMSEYMEGDHEDTYKYDHMAYVDGVTTSFGEPTLVGGEEYRIPVSFSGIEDPKGFNLFVDNDSNSGEALTYEVTKGEDGSYYVEVPSDSALFSIMSENDGNLAGEQWAVGTIDNDNNTFVSYSSGTLNTPAPATVTIDGGATSTTQPTSILKFNGKPVGEYTPFNTVTEVNLAGDNNELNLEVVNAGYSKGTDPYFNKEIAGTGAFGNPIEANYSDPASTMEAWVEQIQKSPDQLVWNSVSLKGFTESPEFIDVMEDNFGKNWQTALNIDGDIDTEAEVNSIADALADPDNSDAYRAYKHAFVDHLNELMEGGSIKIESIEEGGRYTNYGQANQFLNSNDTTGSMVRATTSKSGGTGLVLTDEKGDSIFDETKMNKLLKVPAGQNVGNTMIRLDCGGQTTKVIESYGNAGSAPSSSPISATTTTTTPPVDDTTMAIDEPEGENIEEIPEEPEEKIIEENPTETPTEESTEEPTEETIEEPIVVPETTIKPKDAENMIRIDNQINKDIADNIGTKEFVVQPTKQASLDDLTEKPSAEAYQGTEPQYVQNQASKAAEDVSSKVSEANDYSSNHGIANSGGYMPNLDDDAAQEATDALHEKDKSSVASGEQAGNAFGFN